MKPKGVNQGTLYLALVPALIDNHVTTPITTASIGDRSFEVDIQDLALGRNSGLLTGSVPHATGPAPVAPYVPFATSATFLGLG